MTARRPEAGSASSPPAAPLNRSRVGLVLLALVVAMVVLCYSNAVLGQLDMSVKEVVGSVLHAIGIDGVLPRPRHPNGEVALWMVRLPRATLCIVVGAGLAIAGVLLQGVFANPLAEPSVIGVSSGAAAGAATVIALGGMGSLAAVEGFLGTGMVAAAAFVSGLLTALFVYLASRRDGRTDVVTLILVGVAVNAVAGGVIALMTFVANPTARDQIVFWQMGSMAAAEWGSVALVAALTLPATIVAVLLARQLDLLALGDAQARHLGVRVEVLRTGIIVVVAVLVAAAVAFTGIIGFVGLVVPHMLRMLIGPGHRALIPTAALGGAVALLAADLLARTLVPRADLPIGMVTALIGGPVFFVLLRRMTRVSGTSM